MIRSNWLVRVGFRSQRSNITTRSLSLLVTDKTPLWRRSRSNKTTTLLQAQIVEPARRFLSTFHNEITTENEPSSSSSPSAVVSAIRDASFAHTVKLYNIFDLSSRHISHYKHPDQLTAFVQQLEEAEILTMNDIHERILPVSRLTAMKRYRALGAELTERLLLTCLSRLPESVAERTVSDNNNQWPYPPLTLYNRALIAWGNVESVQGAQRAEAIAELQIAEFSKDPERAAAPSRHTFKSWIRAWAVCHETIGTARSYELLKWLEDLSGVTTLLGGTVASSTMPYNLTGLSLEYPDIGTYNVVLSSLAKAPNARVPHNLFKVTKIVGRLQRLHAVTKMHALDGHTYVMLLLAYRRYVDSQQTIEPAFCNDVLMILDDIHARLSQLTHEQPDAKSEFQVQRRFKRSLDDNVKNDEHNYLFPLKLSWAYNVAVEALLKTPPFIPNLQRAEAIAVAAAGHDSDYKIPNSVLAAAQTRPNHETIAKLAMAWTRSGSPNVEEHVQTLFQKTVLNTPYKRTYDLNQALQEWSKSSYPHAAEIVQSLLDEALSTYSGVANKPTGQSYAICMRAWSRQSLSSTVAPLRVERLLCDMLAKVKYGDDWYQPREIHFRALLTVWVERAGSGLRYDGMFGRHQLPAEHAEATVRWIVEEGFLTENHTISVIAMAIRAWSMQKMVDPKDAPMVLDRVESLLVVLRQVLNETDLLPPFPCNWVLTACCKPQYSRRDRDRAYNLAMDTFSQLSTRNYRSYELMAKVLLTQLDTADNHDVPDAIEGIFRKACASGLLTQGLVWRLVEVADAKRLQSVLGLSYSFASMVVEAKKDFKDKSGPFRGVHPKALMVENMPIEWSAKIEPTPR